MSSISGDLNQSLRNEKAWSEVAGGLGKVLFGYGALVFGWFVAAAFLYAAFAPALTGKQTKIEHVWYFYIGAAALKLSGLASWGLILAGQWRCLMNSPERNGARWVIFICMTCVAAGPVLHILGWLAGTSTPIRWMGGPQAIAGVKVRFTTMGLYLMSASLITSWLYKLTFWYYLQTVAGCMGAKKARFFVWMYFAVLFGAAGFTGWWLTGNLHANQLKDMFPYVIGSWVFVALYWVMQILVVKIAIDQTMSEVYDPMRAEGHRRHYELARS